MSLPRSFAARTPPHALPERMDDPDVDTDTLRACLKSLATVNAASLGYRPTIGFVDRLAARHTPGRPLRILDVGSGYGDTLRAVGRHLARRGVPAQLTGADLNPRATRVAAEATADRAGPVTIRFVTADARALGEEDAPDGVLSGLFMHHLEDEEIVPFLSWMEGAARGGWFVNDLYRSGLAGRGFGLLATLTARHPFVRHDGPVSFARAFRRADWDRLLAASGVRDARVFIGAPFRMCVEKLHE